MNPTGSKILYFRHLITYLWLCDFQKISYYGVDLLGIILLRIVTGPFHHLHFQVLLTILSGPQVIKHQMTIMFTEHVKPWNFDVFLRC